MKRYILQDGSAVVRSDRGDWVRYDDALKQIPAQDSQEAFRAFLARRGVARFHDLYGAVAGQIEALEEEAALHKGCFEEGQENESIRNGDLIQQLETELQRNTSLRTEMEKEVQRTADAYTAMHEARDGFRKASQWNHLTELELNNLRSLKDDLEGYLRAVLEHIAPMLKLYEPNLPEHPVIAAIRDYLEKP